MKISSSRNFLSNMKIMCSSKELITRWLHQFFDVVNFNIEEGTIGGFFRSGEKVVGAAAHVALEKADFKVLNESPLSM